MAVLTRAQNQFLLALVHRIVPESRTLEGPSQGELFAIIEASLATKDASLRRLLSIFLIVLRWLPALRHGAPLDRLSPDTQDRVLRWFEGGPIAPFRKGFWGVKVLVFMGFYGRPEAAAAIGWAPSREGNAFLARHAE